MFQILIIFQPLVPLRKRGEELQVLTTLFINTRILRFTSQLTFAFFAAVSHLSGSLRKQKFTSTDLKGHGLGFVIGGFQSVLCVCVLRFVACDRNYD